ncbi:MAG TPA: type II secretion system F family protein [Thermohalobaculum sp.]|nr:type II secretion system F family protein [Thermohalobaculum sp.]
MARFQYKAVAPGGEVVDGEVAAETRDAALELVRRRGVVPVTVNRAREVRLAGLRLRSRRVRRRDLMLFARQLEMMLAAGAPVDRALEILHRVHADAPLGPLAGEMLERLRGGASLAESLEARGDVFRADFIGMVRAGEAGGALAPALARLADMLERAERLSQSVRSALAYPLLVLVLTGISLVILLVYVVPEFRPMFEDSGVDLPLATAIVVAVSDFATDYGWLAALAAVGAGVLTWSASRTPRGRLALARLRLATPLLGELTRRVETARFCRTLGALLQNGVAILAGLEIAAGTIGNPVIAQAARRAAGPLSRGEGLAGPLAASGAFPSMAVQLIEVGEESGRLPDMLEQVAEVYDRETSAAIERMLALLTPAVTIGLGVLIAFIIGSILAAILGSYSFAV